MATGEQFGTIFDGGTTLGLGPAELLGRFTDRRDEGAFAALVDRHGPMVLATCRRILPDHADADDAFQATFLVLARKASSLSDPDRLAPWLHGVARRVAVRARTRSARRSEVEGEGRGDLAIAPDQAEARELRAVLDEELSRLPAKYRDPLVLCYLEGLTHDEAANQLDWPVGTVRSRLAGGRDRLRDRLTRRGFAPGVLTVLSPATLPQLAVSRLLQVATVRLVFTGSASKLAGPAALLAQGVLTSMMLAKIQTTAIATLAVAATLAAGTTGVVVARQQTAAPGKSVAAPPVVTVPRANPDKTGKSMTPTEVAELNKSLSESLHQANDRIKALEAQLETLGVHPPSPVGYNTTIGSVGVLTRSDPSDPPTESTPPPIAVSPPMAQDDPALMGSFKLSYAPVSSSPPAPLETLDEAKRRIKSLEDQLAFLVVNSSDPVQSVTIGPAVSVGGLPPSDLSNTPPDPATPPIVPVPPNPPGMVIPPEAPPSGTSGSPGIAPSRPVARPYGDSFVVALAGGKKILIESAQRDWIAVVDPAAGGQKVVYRSPDAGSKLGCIIGTDTFRSNSLIPRTPQETQAIALVVEGPRITEGAALSLDDNQWYPVTLAEPLVDGKLDPFVSAGQVLYTAGRYWYAFSPQAKRWGTLELKQPLTLDKSEYGQQMLAAGMQIHQGGMIVPEGDILHLFSAETGQWSHVNFKQAQ